MKRHRTGALLFLAGAAVTSAFFLNLCDWIFECGCRSLWAGAADHCNIHTPGARHCPWCAIPTAGQGAVYLAVLAPQAWWSFFSRWGWIWRLGLTLASFPAVGWALGLALGYWQGYWE